MRLNIGVDLHKHQFTSFSLEDCQYAKNITNKEGYNNFIDRLIMYKKKGYDIHLAVETTGNTRYFVNMVEKFCESVSIVNTLKFKVVCESVNKTDKHDAKTLATFLSKDMLPISKICSKDSEYLKRLLTSRDKLVKTNVRLKNQIHGILLGAGVETKAGLLNSKKGRKNASLLVEDATDSDIINILTRSIEGIIENIKIIEKKIQDLTQNDRVIQILKSIPGTGDICASTVRACIDNIKRFNSPQKLSAYSGLVSFVQCSDEKMHYGKITKRGPHYLRISIIQMVLGMIRCKKEKNNRYMYQYRSLKKRKGSGKALVAIGRKFTVLIWTLITNNEEYDHDKGSAFYNISKLADKLEKDAA